MFQRLTSSRFSCEERNDVEFIILIYSCSPKGFFVMKEMTLNL